ncbi:MAG: FAD-binding oxidoreductase [Acidimicrobiia bacterium]|nr:FAD-binding oxidoreductase [Acidimicrobiia bacterium]
MTYGAVTPEIIDHLVSLLGPDAVSTGMSDRETHAGDESTHSPVVPDVVVYPASTEQVSHVVGVASVHRIPVTPYGAGTGVEGNAIPLAAGIVVDFRDLDSIELHADDFQVTVGAGVLRLDLEDHLGRHGLFFPPDPGANATIGGMIANNAAGIRSLKYGATRDNVLAMTVVLADGRIIKTGSRSVKQSAGYDLRHLIIGSEGTLGLVTSATLKVAPRPEHFATAVVAFPEVATAAEVVHGILGLGLEPAALELLHRYHVKWMNEDEDAGLTEAPSLMIDFNGSDARSVDGAMDETLGVCEASGSIGVLRASGHEERAELWRLRHGTRERYVRRHPGKQIISVDVSVPISEFAGTVAHAEATAAEKGFDLSMVGHAGDGNLHMAVIYDPEEPTAPERAEALAQEVVLRAIEVGGTSTGEHGTGIGKRQYLSAEFGDDAVVAMRAIKQALDPHGILNPGKVLPEAP